MKKIIAIAAREFVATVMTRGFLIGLLLTPALMGVIIYVMPRAMNPASFRVEGEIAIIDRSGVVAEALRSTVNPELMAARRAAATRHLMANAMAAVGGPAAGPAAAAGAGGPGGAAANAAAGITGPLPKFHVVERPSDADVAAERAWLTPSNPANRGHLALIVVRPQAIDAPHDSDATPPGPAYDLYEPSSLDGRIEAAIRQVMRDAVITVRAQKVGLNLMRIDDLMRVDEGKPVTVTREGQEQPSAGIFNRILPFVFLVFMLIGVLSGGQFLLTTMVEEKSSRIIEVLLSAVSPTELLAGKILGQMGASFVGMALYVVSALLALLAFSTFGLVDLSLLLYLLIFFVLSFLVVGSVMVAVGAAVNEMRDAQSLLMPFMLLLATVWIFAAPIALNPNSTLATTLSFTPVVSNFAMMLRVASNTPPEAWQIWLSIAVGIATVFAAIWFAARIFRIALLLHGRPPNLGTLIRWTMAP